MGEVATVHLAFGTRKSRDISSVSATLFFSSLKHKLLKDCVGEVTSTICTDIELMRE